MNFPIVNRNEVEKHSHGSFNRYYIEYPTIFPSPSIKPFIQVEMAFYQKPYPDEIKPINSLIGDWLLDHGRKEEAIEFNLCPFDMCVQKLERTFIDEVFAICDYYERREATRNSRHIYDLYKIISKIDITNPVLKNLVEAVRKDRMKDGRCISARAGCEINGALKRIKESDFFKSDYNNVTAMLLTTYVDYAHVITVLDQIVGSKLFAQK